METPNCIETQNLQVRSAAFTGLFELRADTAPGNPGPLAAPSPCRGPAAYRDTIRHRFRADPGARQQIAVLARRLRPSQHAEAVPVTGPFAAEARAVLEVIRSPKEDRR